jgi:hypothetical protein
MLKIYHVQPSQIEQGFSLMPCVVGNLTNEKDKIPSNLGVLEVCFASTVSFSLIPTFVGYKDDRCIVWLTLSSYKRD